jgi:hypothetical protein
MMLEEDRAPVVHNRFSGELSHDAIKGVIFHYTDSDVSWCMPKREHSRLSKTTAVTKYGFYGERSARVPHDLTEK